MSQHATHTETYCRCGNPTHNNATVCEPCADRLHQALGDIPSLTEELDITLTRTKAIDYSTSSGATESPLPADQRASKAITQLRQVLVSWALFCDEEGLRHQSPDDGLPDNNLPAISRWLIWRIDALTHHDLGPEAVEAITDAVTHCWHVIDRPPETWFAGPCDQCGTDLHARRREGDVTCHTCGLVYDVAARRDWLLATAEDYLAPASEVARAVTWLDGRRLTPGRIRMWAHRGQIAAKTHRDGRPLYRIGDAITLLAKDASKEAS